MHVGTNHKVQVITEPHDLWGKVAYTVRGFFPAREAKRVSRLFTDKDAAEAAAAQFAHRVDTVALLLRSAQKEWDEAVEELVEASRADRPSVSQGS